MQLKFHEISSIGYLVIMAEDRKNLWNLGNQRAIPPLYLRAIPEKIYLGGENGRQYIFLWVVDAEFSNYMGQGSKNPLVRSYLQVPQAAGQVKFWMIPNVN